MDGNMEDIVDNSMECLSSGCSSDNNETSNDLELLPRVGDEYQVEIPELMMENGLQEPADTSNCWSVGLPVLVMWVYGDGETTESEAMKTHRNQDFSVNIHGLAATENSKENKISLNDEDAQHKVEPLGTVSNYSKEAKHIMSKLQPEVGGSRTNVNFCLPLKKETVLDYGKKGGHFLPGLATNTLQGIEYDSFLLGLYIFGKNLRFVKQFVGSRKMGDILSNYYGKFYRTAEYLRWSQSRKMKTRRCVQGERIFTGWRLHELLSRIFSRASEESKKLLIEVSNRFREGKTSLEDYVFTLKDMVGVSVLVEAVSIGKGKQDLTGTAIDPSKTSQVLQTRHEIPSGQACSSLTKGEIIKFLTGVRLSKAKAGDLFWEAVWPRLLARGWHSEQPRDQVYTGSNNSLVFLVPGVKKFSRRKLTKGSHYFDSVTDVLNKVAAEPVHLELESETENIVEDKEEFGSDPDVVPNKRRRCYLQPVNSKCNQDSMKFTIVDTSLFSAGKRGKVIELRDLPVDTVNLSTQSSVLRDTERDNPKESQNDAEANYTPKHMDNIVDIGALTDSRKCVISNATNHMPSSPDARNASLRNHEGQRTTIPSDTQLSKMVKFHFSRKRKSQKASNCESVKDLTACKQDVSIHGAKAIAEDTKLNGAESRPVSNSSDRCEVKKFLSSSPQYKSVSSMACNPEENSKEVVSNTFMDKKPSLEIQSQISIDLNLPHVPPVSGTDEPVHINNNSSTIRPSILPETSNQPELLNPCNNETGIEQQPGITGRRQSTRNRPLTTKALEAFAFEFSNPKKKKKGEDTMSRRRS